MNAKTAIHWSWTNLEIAELLRVPLAKKLLVPQVNIMLSFEDELA